MSGRVDLDHLSGHKRKAEPGELAKGAPNRFRIVSQLVIAMKRFQGEAALERSRSCPSTARLLVAVVSLLGKGWFLASSFTHKEV